MAEETSNEALQELAKTVETIGFQIKKMATLTGKRKKTRIAKIDTNISMAIEDAYDIFSEDSESNPKIQTLKTAYKLFTEEQYKVSPYKPTLYWVFYRQPKIN